MKRTEFECNKIVVKTIQNNPDTLLAIEMVFNEDISNHNDFKVNLALVRFQDSGGPAMSYERPLYTYENRGTDIDGAQIYCNFDKATVVYLRGSRQKEIQAKIQKNVYSLELPWTEFIGDDAKKINLIISKYNVNKCYTKGNELVINAPFINSQIFEPCQG